MNGQGGTGGLFAVRAWLDTAFAGLLVLCAVTLVFLRLQERRPKTRVEEPPVTIAEWQKLAGVGHRIGPTDAKVVITEFSDFQCPFCKRLKYALDTIRTRYPTEIAIVYRHYPIERLHPVALKAAYAAVCADRVGKFGAFHDSLYAAQRSLITASWTGIAKGVGIADTAAFARCMTDSATARAVKADIDAGRQLGVTGTPTVLINDKLLKGAPSVDAIERIAKPYLQTGSAPEAKRR